MQQAYEIGASELEVLICHGELVLKQEEEKKKLLEIDEN